MGRIIKEVSAIGSSAVARTLARMSPARARDYYFFYRRKTLTHPNMFGPIRWEKTIRLPYGFSMRVPFFEVHGMSLITTGQYEEELTDRIVGHLKLGDTFVDVGANMGYFTLLASQLVGGAGEVIAIEPCARNLAWLTTNLALNDSRNVLLIASALSDHASRTRISIPPRYNNGVSNVRRSTVDEPHLAALAQRFDDLSAWGIDPSRVKLVKIDTEGHELHVLRGMASLLQTDQPLAIACELSPHWYNVDTLVRLLGDYGFKGEFFAGDSWHHLSSTASPDVQCNAWFTRD